MCQLFCGLADNICMKKIAVIWASIVVLIVTISVVFEVERFFLNEKYEKVKAQIGQHQLQAQKLEKKMIAQREEELRFRNFVAAMQPEIMGKYKGLDEESYVARSLASVYGDHESLRLEVGVEDKELEKGKALFRSKHYDESIQVFSSFEEKYSYHPKLPEALFLKSESYFAKRDVEGGLQSSLALLELYPEHDLSGFILLRVAEVYESRQENLKAREVYATIINKFENKTLTSMAQQKNRQLQEKM